jgi:hypothetical protein
MIFLSPVVFIFKPYGGQRFVGAADPISAASRDVFQSDIERELGTDVSLVSAATTKERFTDCE